MTHDGSGKGGPNAEFVLAMAGKLGGQAGIWALACDTDGIDGSEDNAGAWCGPSTMSVARNVGADLTRALAEHNSYGFFKAVDALVISGPTLTNVNDFRAVFVDLRG